MGWQDDAIVAPAPAGAPTQAPATAQQPWEKDAVVSPAPGQPRTAHGIGDAWTAGWQGSLAGLIDRNALPDVVLDPHNSQWYERATASASRLVNEAPEMVAGMVGGGAAGSLVAPGLGTVIGAGAGGFALPTAIRESYAQALRNGEIVSSSDYLDRAKIAVKQLFTKDVALATGKDALVGGLTGGVGRAVGVVAPAIGLGSKATMAAQLGAEGATLTVAPAALEGRLPEPQEWLDAAVLLGGMKAAHSVATKLTTVYAKTGKTPAEVLVDAQKDPTITEDLVREAPAAPKWYTGAPQELTATRTLAEQSARGNAEGQFAGPGHYITQSRDLAGTYGGKEGRAYEVAEPFSNAFDFNKVTDGKSGQTRYNEMVERVGSKTEANAELQRQGYDAITLTSPRGEKIANIFEQRQVTDIGPAREAPKAAGELTLEPLDEVPRAYRDLARETNARDAVPEPGPDVARQFTERPFADIPQAPGEPVLATHVNYNYLNTQLDVQGALSRLSELHEAKIREATRGQVPNAQTVLEARKLFENVTGEKAPAPIPGATYSKLAADIYARKEILIEGAEHLMALRDGYVKARDAGLATDTQRLELAAQQERVSLALAETRGAQAEVGRALQILKTTNRDKAYYEKLREVLDDGGRGKFDDMVDLMGDMGTPAQALKFAEKASRATTWEKVVEAWKSALVSGPITQAANIIGNFTFAAARPLVDAAAVAVSKARGLVGGEEVMSAVEPLARVTGNVMGVLDGLKVAGAVLRDGTDLTKMEVHKKAIEGTLGEVVRTPFRLLGAADAFFRVVNERGEAYTLAVREATKEGYNPATREFRERVADMVENPTDKMQAAIDEAGVRFTFNAPLGKFSKDLQSLVRAGHMEMIVPFIKTPTNILKEMVRLTPAAPLVGEWKAAFKEGGVARDKAIAEMAVGTAMSATVMTLAMSGSITGQGDPDPRKSAVQLASGWQPYSIKVGDTYYSYQRLQPIGTLIGMAADAADVVKHSAAEERDKLGKILATAFANAVTNQTFLQGISNIMGAITSPDAKGPRFIQGLAASVVPGVIGQTAQIMDPYKREVYSVIDAIQNRIPVMREELFPKRDAYGVEIPEADRFGAIVPVTRSKESTDKVRTEASRLEIGAAKAPKSIELPAGHDSKLGKIELTDKQKDVFASSAGHLAHEILTQVVNSEGWDALPDMAQRLTMNAVFEKARSYGNAMAVPPEQIMFEAQRIATELGVRMRPK